jgi:di/tricarboxylate transporter/predicted amino acid-binding ACT domain protein
VEGFGAFCEEHGLEVITNEVEDSVMEEQDTDVFSNFPIQLRSGQDEEFDEDKVPERIESPKMLQSLELGVGKLASIPEVDTDIGMTKQSLLQSEDMERLRYINRIQDIIRGVAVEDDVQSSSKKSSINAPPKIVVHVDSKYNSAQTLVVVAVDAQDRPGLLLDISKTLIRLGLNFHKTEAMAIEGRSLSLWRCEVMKDGVSDIEEIWSVLSAMLEVNTGIEAVKRKGIRVIRSIIPKGSQLIGTNATEINFREKYKAAIVAVQRDGKAVPEKLSQIRFSLGDILVLQVSDDSPLLVKPPKDFYKKSVDKGKFAKFFAKKRFGSFGSISDANSVEQSSDHDSSINEDKDYPNTLDQSVLSKDEYDVKGSICQAENESEALPENEDGKLQHFFDSVWRDIAVAFDNNGPKGANESDGISREFLTAMQIRSRSSLSKKTAVELGVDKLPGVFLVSIERTMNKEPISKTAISKSNSFDEETLTESAPKPISLDEPLEDGDILWFSGTANAIGDLRKIPGLRTFVNAEVKKINEKVYDRRLVQAVISRRSKLVGKTAREARFRSKFGAVVIAVHREGRRVHEHPGRIKLQAGDVLLLEAGPTFLRQSVEKDQSFALLSEVEDSVPPRLKLLIPALFLTVAMLAVYTAGVASLFVCGLVASMIMCLLGIITQQEIRDAINWEVYITIACAFGIGSALTNSGVAGGIADGFVRLGSAIDIGNAGLYGAVYCGTFLISNVVTNNAAAALIFPIAMDAAEQTGADRKLMSYILMLGASASFMSPFGYTTNLLIYGPGGYKTVDFLRFGTPLQILLWILSVIFVSADKSKWFVSWIASAMVLICVSMLLISNIKCNFKRSHDD